MKGDFSRDTFDRHHHFSRVLMQQGRVLLDADWNEQTAIVLHYLRTLAADIIGPRGGPGDGFKISCSDDLKCDFFIGWGALLRRWYPLREPAAAALSARCTTGAVDLHVADGLSAAGRRRSAA